ncbi:MAG: LptF/LptG family permease [Chitinophagales bacterium]|nr:LptF/LptG family permease [Chitinophagales bacterium]
MKKLDQLILKNFIGPFILTFCIAQFVLVMQFLWKYIDDLVGKGLSNGVLLELLLYASARLVPMALPLAVLLASIMTLGALGENYELTAIKSSGVSLLRFMRALTLTAIGIGVFAFVFSNYMLPKANLKYGALLYDIRHQKPTVAIKPGIFFKDIENFYIKAESKDDETNTLFNITVYDHSSGRGNDHVIIAEKGVMIQDEEALSLTMRLENGRQYREVEPKDAKENNHELVYTQFKTWEKRFDLSDFQLSRTDENFFKDLKQMLNLNQLLSEMDTLNNDKVKLGESFASYIVPYYNIRKYEKDSATVKTPVDYSDTGLLASLAAFDLTSRVQVVERAMNKARNIKNYADVSAKQIHYKNREITEHMIEVYRKFTLSVACVVLYFIGAPLGSIIRKGGLGWPLFYSVLFFMLYHVTSIIGEKLAENDVLSAFSGMWLSTFLLLPLGILLTVKASADSRFFAIDYYRNNLRRFFGKSFTSLSVSR